jgi:23S rRNA (cytosine1962-C5)-methyltransferase
MTLEAQVSRRGAERWSHGHPWIYASDVTRQPDRPGIAAVSDHRGKFLGQALFSPRSEIRLRLLEPTDRRIDAEWWRQRIAQAYAHRRGIDATAYRVVHGEGDGLPSLIVDRYDRWIVAQLLSAGLEAVRDDVMSALHDVLSPQGILLRNDAAVRRHEGLAEEVQLAAGQVPHEVEVREGTVRFWAALWTGQKTGAFLDQRPNRERAAAWTPAGAKALDCFSYHGSFALHLARRAGSVLAIDESRDALERGAKNAALNGLANIHWQQGNAFEVLRELERASQQFHLIVVDPPAFAKSRTAVAGALRGYKEINLRAMKLLEPGGILLSASCSYHVKRADFLGALGAAAADAGRRVTILEHLGQGIDHPEVLTIPETAYLKGVVLRVD